MYCIHSHYFSRFENSFTISPDSFLDHFEHFKLSIFWFLLMGHRCCYFQFSLFKSFGPNYLIFVAICIIAKIWFWNFNQNSISHIQSLSLDLYLGSFRTKAFECTRQLFGMCGSSQQFLPKIIAQTSLRHNYLPLVGHTHTVPFLLPQSWHQLPFQKPGVFGLGTADPRRLCRCAQGDHGDSEGLSDQQGTC